MSIGIGRIHINGKPYNIAGEHEAYKVTEIPSHGDVDPQMERRVIYRSFSGGIKKEREETSMDATASHSPSFSFIRQNKISEGINFASGGDTRIAERIFAQRAVTASNFAQAVETPNLFGDTNTAYSWCISNKSVWATTNETSWSLIATSTPVITDAVQYGGFLYVALGTGNAFYTWAEDGIPGTFTQRGNNASKFTVLREQLWRANGANIYSTVNIDPANQVWSSATVVGDPSTNITSIDVFQDFLMIFKQDGIYGADKSGNVYPIFPGFKNLGMNPRPLGQWRDLYFFASDYGMVWTYSPRGGVERVGFDLAEPYPMGSGTPVFSIPNAGTRGIALTNVFIVGFNQYNAGATGGAYFFAFDGAAWHPFRYFPNATATGLGFIGGYVSPNPVLQFGITQRTGANPNQIWYMQNPLIDPFLAASFDTTPQVIYLPVDNGALEDEYKVLERLNIWVDNSAAGTVRIAYALDDNIASLSFVDMGPPKGDKATGYQVFTPPQPLPMYHKIQLRITLTATLAASSPQLRYIILHYKQRTPQRRVWQIKMIADQNIIGADGRVDARNSKQIIGDLNAARILHQQVELIDALQNTNQVYVDEVEEVIQVLKGNQNPSYIVTVKLVEAVVDN